MQISGSLRKAYFFVRLRFHKAYFAKATLEHLVASDTNLSQ